MRNSRAFVDTERLFQIDSSVKITSFKLVKCIASTTFFIQYDVYQVFSLNKCLCHYFSLCHSSQVNHRQKIQIL